MKNKKIDKEVGDKIVELGQLVLQFARVDRITLYEDGKTQESDTDHTVMLSLIACSIAADYKKEINLGLVAQFALVHDLVEAYAGDTPNLHGKAIDHMMKDKEKREHDALKKIEKKFGRTLPWLHTTIKKYEKLDTPEARFVKALDKAMPKITHSLNKVIVLKHHGHTKKSAEKALFDQIEKIESSYGSDQKEVIRVLKLVAQKAIKAF